MGWLSREKEEVAAASHEGVIARIGAYSPGEYSVHLILLEGAGHWVRMEAGNRQIEERIALSAPGDRVEFVLRMTNPNYGVCLDFHNETLAQQLAKANAQKPEPESIRAEEPAPAPRRMTVM